LTDSNRKDLFEITSRKDEAKSEWRNRNERYLGYYVNYLTRLQNRRTLHYELIFSVIGLGLLVNLASEAVSAFIRACVEYNRSVIIEQSLILVVLSSFTVLFASQFDNIMKKFDPNPRSLYLPITLFDCSKYDEENYAYIYNFLESKSLTEFKAFSERFFTNLEGWYSFLFHPIKPVITKYVTEYEKVDFNEQFPTTTKTFDISQLNNSNKKMTMSIILRPHIIYSFGSSGSSNVRNINIDLKLDFEDPLDPQADDIISELYWFRLGGVPEYISRALSRSFHPLIDEINPAKQHEEVKKRFEKQQKRANSQQK